MSDLKKAAVIVFTGFLFSFVSFAGNPDSIVSPVRPDKDYFKSFVTDTRDVFTAPISWNSKQWIFAGSSIALTGSAFYADDYLQQFSQSQRRVDLDNLSKWGIEPLGSGFYSIPALGLLYCYGKLSKDIVPQQAALTGVKAYAVSALIVHLPKYVFQRQRPLEAGSNPFLFEGPLGNFKNTSFVSGHTTVAFAMASAISGYYPSKPVVNIVLYSLAGAVALSRMYDNKHWGSDVIGGAFLGFSIGKLVHKNDKKRYRELIH